MNYNLCRGLCHARGTCAHPDYFHGDKFCRLCARSWKAYPGQYCKCCGGRLAARPRGRKAKARIEARRARQ